MLAETESLTETYKQYNILEEYMQFFWHTACLQTLKETYVAIYVMPKKQVSSNQHKVHAKNKQCLNFSK